MNILIEQSEIERQRRIAAELVPLLAGKAALVRTFGCQQNEADGERIAGALLSCGYTLTDDEESADLVILNTCAIREHAEERVLGAIGALKKKKEKRGILIGLCGCMAQEPHRRELLQKSYPYVDFVFGTDMTHRVPEILQNALESRKQRQYCSDLPHDEFGVIGEGTPVARRSAYRALVSVMYGCNNFCSYCIVPYVRGRERSRESGQVLAEVRSLADAGYKDIMLLGQNVNSYRGELSFPQLLERCAETEGDFWLRFMTSHPKDASPELVEVMKRQKKLANHFHLPFQSGNDRVLTAMNRKYDRQTYLEKALRIRDGLPDVSVTSDVIVGFPTETEAEFLDTVELVKRVKFDMLYIFIYSPRRGTAAERMDGRVPREEQVRRFQYLSQVEDGIALERNLALVGKTVRVLSDGKNAEGKNVGRSGQNKIVTLDGEIPAGRFCEAEITAAKPYALEARIKR